MSDDAPMVEEGPEFPFEPIPLPEFCRYTDAKRWWGIAEKSLDKAVKRQGCPPKEPGKDVWRTDLIKPFLREQCKMGGRKRTALSEEKMRAQVEEIKSRTKKHKIQTAILERESLPRIEVYEQMGRAALKMRMHCDSRIKREWPAKAEGMTLEERRKLSEEICDGLYKFFNELFLYFKNPPTISKP